MTQTIGQAPLGEISPTLVESMMNRLLLLPALFQEVSTIMAAEHFYKPEEQHFALLWTAMRDVFDRYAMFDYTTLRTKAEELLCSWHLPEQLRWQLMAEPDGVLFWTMHNTELVQQLRMDQSRDIVRMFLRERMVYADLRRALDVGIPADLGQTIAAAAERLQRVDQVDSNPLAPAVLGLVASPPVVVRPTGVPWLDRYMDGGHGAGEVLGLLGPTGVGKTLLGCNIAEACARITLDESARTGQPPRMVYFVTYELRRAEVLGRLIACAAGISAETLKNMDEADWGMRFSSAVRGDYKPYELTLPVPNGEVRPGETERYRNTLPLLNLVNIIDMSGASGQNSRTGAGGVKELSGLIANHQAQVGNPGVEVIIIDYVLLAVTRILEGQGKDLTRHMRIEIPHFLDQCKTQLAGRFNAPVWALHQLNTAGNKKSVVDTNGHNDAAECGSFAHYTAFCAALGTKDPQTNCTLLSFSKRRRAGDYVPPVVIKIDGTFAKMLDGTEDYVVSTAQRRILPRALVSQIAGPSAAALPPHHADNFGVAGAS